MKKKSPLKVLFLSHIYPNRVRPTNGIFVEELAKALSSRCHIRVISPIPIFPWLSRTMKYKNFNRILYKIKKGQLVIFHPRFFIIPKFLKCTDWIFYFLCVYPFLAKIKKSFDVILVHWGYPDGIAAYLSARLLGKKVVLLVHGNESLSFFETSIRKVLIKWYLKKMDHIIAVSMDLKNKMILFYHVNSDRISVIPNGIDQKLLIQLTREDTRKKLGIALDEKMLITVARLSKEKCLDVLIKAFLLFQDKINNDAKLYIVGEGSERKKLEILVEKEAAANQIKFVGNIQHSEVLIWLKAADLFCLSSNQEGCPVSIIEALACKCPVVATRVGGIPELVPDVDYGLLVPPGEPQKLSEAIQEALRRKWDHEKIGLLGKSYTWEKSANKIFRIFQDMIRN